MTNFESAIGFEVLEPQSADRRVITLGQFIAPALELVEVPETTQLSDVPPLFGTFKPEDVVSFEPLRDARVDLAKMNPSESCWNNLGSCQCD